MGLSITQYRYATGWVVPYKRVISNVFINMVNSPSLKFSDLHTVLIVVNTLMVTFK
jgi:hypothetical protein